MDVSTEREALTASRGDTVSITEWQCECGVWNPMRKAFCACGKFWQATERHFGWLVTR